VGHILNRQPGLEGRPRALGAYGKEGGGGKKTNWRCSRRCRPPNGPTRTRVSCIARYYAECSTSPIASLGRDVRSRPFYSRTAEKRSSRKLSFTRPHPYALGPGRRVSKLMKCRRFRYFDFSTGFGTRNSACPRSPRVV
jgi:hypothetical protein